jgi:hypothetical protein
MAHFAKVENGKVVNVIVAEQDFIDSGVVGHGWIQTSYNTHANTHPENRPLRGNFAGIGDIYDSINDVFYSIQPYNSWILNTSKWSWEAPIAYPDDGKTYKWHEDTVSWKEITSPTPVETLP